MAAAALGEPDRHMAIRFLSEALEGGRRGRPYLRSALPARYRDQVDIVDLVSNPRIGLNFPTAYSKSVTGDI
jgi:hypothetical protein